MFDLIDCIYNINGETIGCHAKDTGSCTGNTWISGETCTLDCSAKDHCQEDGTLQCRAGDSCIIDCDADNAWKCKNYRNISNECNVW